jgi:hypothetical protein
MPTWNSINCSPNSPATPPFPVVRQFERPISHSLRVPFADRERIWAPAVEHRAIAAAISAGDIEGARQAMQHIVNAAQRRSLILSALKAGRLFLAGFVSGGIRSFHRRPSTRKAPI